MAGILIEVTEALKDELNSLAQSTPLTPGFSAKRFNVGPRYSREELSSVQVSVVPKSCTKVKEESNRVHSMYAIETWVGIQKGLTSDSNVESDPLVSLGEQIAELFDNGKVLTDVNGTCVAVDFGSGDETPFMSIRDQNESLLYTGILILTFKVLR